MIKEGEHYIGEDIPVFVTNGNGADIETTATFKYNSVNNKFPKC